MKTQRISTGYTPRPIQLTLHQSLRRFNVLVCHRRFGKTVFCINEMVDRGLRCTLPNPRYAYLAPLYGQAKRVAWDYLKMYTANIPGATPNEADLRVDIPSTGARFTLLGAENPAALKGIYLDGVILDEYAEMNPAAWREVIRPTLSDRLGWAIFIGTPKGRNSFWEIYNRYSDNKHPKWFTAMYKASQTGIISSEELELARAEMTEDEYEQEFECSFAAGLVGAYYAKELAATEANNRITDVPWQKEIPVDTYWDLGMNDTTCIWFIQQIGNFWHVIDYLEDSGTGLPEWAKRLREKPYVYGRHVFPHDVAAREMGTGKSREETLRSLGIRPHKVPRQAPEDGINAARLIFNRLWFDKANCARGLECLRNYQRKWDSKALIFSSQPLHNWASNGADAFRTFAMGSRENRPDTFKLQARAESSYDVYSF